MTINAIESIYRRAFSNNNSNLSQHGFTDDIMKYYKNMKAQKNVEQGIDPIDSRDYQKYREIKAIRDDYRKNWDAKLNDQMSRSGPNTMHECRRELYEIIDSYIGNRRVFHADDMEEWKHIAVYIRGTTNTVNRCKVIANYKIFCDFRKRVKGIVRECTSYINNIEDIPAIPGNNLHMSQSWKISILEYLMDSDQPNSEYTFSSKNRTYAEFVDNNIQIENTNNIVKLIRPFKTDIVKYS